MVDVVLLCRMLCLNPFESQVYFHRLVVLLRRLVSLSSLNPFESQVYFHLQHFSEKVPSGLHGLNPFESQVYFHTPTMPKSSAVRRLS